MIYKQRDRHSQVVEERCVDRQVIILTMKRAKYRRIDIAVVAFETKSNKDGEATELETKQHSCLISLKRLIIDCKLIANYIICDGIPSLNSSSMLTMFSSISNLVLITYLTLVPAIDAEYECRKRGANLPAIRDNDRRIFADPTRIWLSAKRRKWTHVSLDLGLSYELWPDSEPSLNTDRKTHRNVFVWIGYKYNESNTDYYWYDGTPIINADWKPRAGYGEDCVLLNETGDWEQTSCEDMNAVVCMLEVPYDPELYRCNNDRGCLRTAGYWNITKVTEVYMGNPDMVVENVGTFEECWDICVNYIGFVCLIITYESSSQECRLSSNNSADSWQQSDTLRSRTRSRLVTNPDSYCTKRVLPISTYAEAIETCDQNKTGWTVPVILDGEMQEKLSKENHEIIYWISAKTTMNQVYKTHQNEYIRYSQWEKASYGYSGNCVRVMKGRWIPTDCNSNWTVVCLGYLDQICKHFPTLQHGRAVINETSGDVVYTCDEQYIMPTLNKTSYYVHCDCSWERNLEALENCAAIECPVLETFTNGTRLTRYGLKINDTLLCKSPYGQQVAETGSTYYNLTCNWVPNTALAVWSDVPRFEGTRAVNTTCTIDDSGDYAHWCWVPPCEAIVCPTPEDSINGTTINITGFMINDTVLHQCPYGYQVTETGLIYYNLTCNLVPGTTTAVWSEHPQLEPLNCSSKEYLMSKATFIKYGTALGSVIQVVCDEGYHIYNSSTNTVNTTCVLDKFGTSADWCWVPPCEEPDVVSMANYMIFGNTVNDTVTYTCQTNYIINGTSTNKWNATCGYDENLHGVWLDIPTCEGITCSDPVILPNASLVVSPDSTEIGATATYDCHEYLTLYRGGHQVNDTNSFNMTCLVNYYNFTGVWFAEEICDMIVCAEAPTISKALLLSSSTNIGDTAQYSCDPGYRVANVTPITTEFQISCYLDNTKIAANWSDLPVCEGEDTEVEIKPIVRQCSAPENTKGASLQYKDTFINSVATYVTHSGYTYESGSRARTIMCQPNGQWSATETSPKGKVCPQIEVIGATMSTERNIRGTQVKISCITLNAKLENGLPTMIIKCTDIGKWSYVPKRCEVGRCPPVPEIKNAEPDTRQAINGTTAVYTCTKGYVLPDGTKDMTVVCDGVTWNITETACIKKNCSVLNFTHTTWVKQGYSFGDVVKFTCDDGYHYDNNMMGVLECQDNSEWNGDTKGCLPRDCGPPPEMKYSTRTVPLDSLYGAVVTYQCFPNYRLKPGVTNTSVFCTKFGTWSNTTGNCTIIKCPAVPVWDDMEANSTNNIVGTTINISCSVDKENANGFLLSHCTPDAVWEPSFASCKSKKALIFEPKPEEAKSSRSIGVGIIVCIMLVAVSVVISDIPTFIRTIKGREVKNSERTKKLTRNASGSWNLRHNGDVFKSRMA
ncbi:hypothetical protein LSH36_662g04077 [Paralvinella palmiformis]|uniref:Uncharacterized protein n=1 Tax=Paralvinella palmiformis TaxID=53620 RepID=A0AAD9J2X4_9ANNE|nr:hypothetical protein LSH36_662g04077 [Paralvinella palmiformis]